MLYYYITKQHQPTFIDKTIKTCIVIIQHILKMTSKLFEDNESIDDLLDSLFDEANLADRFTHKLVSLQISVRQALKTMQLESRTLEGILEGSQTTVDIKGLLKVSSFLELPIEKTFILYCKSVLSYDQEGVDEVKKRAFILNNFDLKSLKKDGFIDDELDIKVVEDKLTTFFGLKTILQYKRDSSDQAVYSSSKRAVKNNLTRAFWINTAEGIFKYISNPNPFHQEQLEKIFHQLKVHSIDVNKGLFYAIRMLYQVGVTVIYIPKSSGIHVRGATFAVNGKPCIVITDYTSFYPSLWFALIHELYHVIFDWEEIIADKNHLTSELEETLINEVEANSFARDYFIPPGQLESLEDKIEDRPYIYSLANKLRIHPSFIYIFYCYHMQEAKPRIFSRYRHELPDISKCLENLGAFSWKNANNLESVARQIIKVFNSI